MFSNECIVAVIAALIILRFAIYARRRILDRKIGYAERNLVASGIEFDDLKRNPNSSLDEDLAYYYALTLRHATKSKFDGIDMEERHKIVNMHLEVLVENLNSFWFCVTSYLTNTY